ncbi:hypothetical protein TWF788_007691 [Orbilia oligospora]|uniref:Uncharacterized protein n=1 Tax=Orbilia oligospora TaxID=2813651 RepID=A0A7C8TW18_ORBOL|nr:hypothetical protein TWF788_007691 [Orbilia oligospora]KAF3209929.1 hypothetical protein TWF679_007153 [Orbilia oligospora]
MGFRPLWSAPTTGRGFAPSAWFIFGNRASTYDKLAIAKALRFLLSKAAKIIQENESFNLLGRRYKREGDKTRRKTVIYATKVPELVENKRAYANCNLQSSSAPDTWQKAAPALRPVSLLSAF